MMIKIYQMKAKNLLMIIGISSLAITSCSKSFLEKVPQGQLSDSQVANGEGVEGLLIGAYGLLNGNVNGTWGNYASAPSQWIFGELTSDNAHKGSEGTDQPNMNLIESYDATSTNDNLSVMWTRYYEGVLRCNNTLRVLALDQSGEQNISAERATQIQAEARMLRAHYYFFLWRVFVHIPYIDEHTTSEEAKTKPNDVDVLPKIVEDLTFAKDNLPTEKINGEVGRVDKYVAEAYLGKVLLYQKKYAEALPLFQDVISAKGNIENMPFQNNFDVTKENGPEVVFAVQHAISPDGGSDNANVGDMLSGLYGTSPVGCCGFYQPTIDLVNAYKVDEEGLPFLDGGYRTDPYLSDFGLTGDAKENYELNVNLRFDPRLDYTVGRRGVPYLDYGIMPGDPWIRLSSYAGPFVGIKTMVPTSQYASNTAAGAAYITGLDVNLIRLGDVVLMAAECQVELNNLPEALKLVNSIRKRAAKLPAKMVGGTPVAKYDVKPYPVFASQEYARKAVRFERRLELAMEGHRFFDLVRWGIAKETLTSYSAFEGKYLSSYKNLEFKDRSTYFPIPQDQIDRSSGTLKQNEGY